MNKAYFVKNYLTEWLRNEVDINYRVDHPNIVKLHTHFEDDKYVYFIMQIAEKGSLSNGLIKPGKYSEF